MYKSTITVVALLSVASAQSTVSLYLPGFGKQAIDASVVGSVRLKCSKQAMAIN